MTVTSSGLSDALRSLERVIVPPPPGVCLGNWRWCVRQSLTGMREVVAVGELGLGVRERAALIARLTTLASDVLDRPDVEAVRGELRRLVGDVRRLAAQAA